MLIRISVCVCVCKDWWKCDSQRFSLSALNPQSCIEALDLPFTLNATAVTYLHQRGRYTAQLQRFGGALFEMCVLTTRHQRLTNSWTLWQAGNGVDWFVFSRLFLMLKRPAAFLYVAFIVWTGLHSVIRCHIYAHFTHGIIQQNFLETTMGSLFQNEHPRCSC